MTQALTHLPVPAGRARGDAARRAAGDLLAALGLDLEDESPRAASHADPSSRARPGGSPSAPVIRARA